MRKTILLHNKNHSIPRCLEGVITDLKKLEGIIRLGVGSFGNKSKYVPKLEWKPQTVDSKTGTIKINVRYREFSQDLWLTINPPYLSQVTDFLNNYKV